ncbi:4'-phosphopantetheinyl transferase superfamily protein [Desulfosarcina sp. OttesenSCG-928-A07]|nr:4'-phosphopantetheinyl transferase superfamily protein [Desulfosarcina sp. OttesenSCG-928-G17]MDL2329352.1 4'-phosphopantetheinyl transferase superfamily protein [Desulfosarcina sp. OttesenSCG-928-A07]
MTGIGAVLYPVILKIPSTHQMTDRRKRTPCLSRLARHALVRSVFVSGFSGPEWPCPDSDPERLDQIIFPKDADGAPLPMSGIYWSLSHKPEVVGGVAATAPVGIDLETVRPVHSGLFSKIADEAEWALFPDGKTQMNFFRVWTAKEAVIKAVGVGFAGIFRCRVKAVADNTRMTLIFDAIPWQVQHHFFDRYMAAITVPSGVTVSWQIVGQISDLSPEITPPASSPFR